MREILNKLEAFGISENAAKIYTHLLTNADIPAFKIATGTKIPRTTVYKVLDDLESQGLTSSWRKNNVKHYSAENPENLRRILKNKEEVLNDVFGDLKDMFKLEKDNPKTRILLGKDGVKYAFEHILDTMVQEDIKMVYAITEKELTETLPKFFGEWRDRKNKKTNATTYLIVPKGLSSDKDYSSDEYRVAREFPDKNPFGCSMDIIGPNIYFFSFKENEIYSIIIESKIVAEMMKKVFMYIWQTLDPKPQKN